MSALALWTSGPGRVELRPAEPGPPAPGELQARALVSGISRGTESLVFHGRLPASEWERMRCPFQEGEFPYPVKYGYAMVGAALSGAMAGKRLFCLHPHQSLFNLPAQAAVEVPDVIPTERAVLAPQMETALNATWDAELRPGERVAVIGAGVIGLLTGYLASRTAEVTVIDVNPRRRAVAEHLGLNFAAPEDAPAGCRTVFHASASEAGLNLALSLCAFEGQVIELSWFGDKRPAVDLGGAFHSQRLTLKASQVGAVSPSRRADYDFTKRLTEALGLCADPRLDVLVRSQTRFTDLPARMESILSDPDTLCHLITYEALK